MSDPQNMPVTGKLKRLGGEDLIEASQISEKELSEELNENTETGADFADEFSVLQDQSVFPSNPTFPSSTGSDLRLRDKTNYNLDTQEQLDKSQDESRCEAGFLSKIFGNVAAFTPKTRMIFFGLILGLIVFGALASFKTIFINILLAVASFQIVRVFSMQEKTLNHFGLFPARVLVTLLFSSIAIFLPLSYKWWQEEGCLYLEEIQNVEKLANEGQQKIKDAVETAGKQVGGHISGEDVETHEFQYSAKIAQTFNEKTYLSGSGLLGMYFQYVFFLSALLFAPFIKERDLTQTLPLKENEEGLSWKFASYFMLRLTKAVVIAVILAVGLKFAGYKNVFFVAGSAFVLTVLTRFGLVFGLALCVPVVVTQFTSTDTGLRSLVILAVTGIVSVIFEKKLHWLMIILPMRKDGIIPPSMLKEPSSLGAISEESSGGGMFRILGNFISLAISLVIYGSVAFFGYTVYNVYTNHSEGRESINAALKSLPAQKDEAFKSMEDYRQRYPNDREAILSIAKAYFKVGEITKAIETANAFRDFQEVEIDKDQDLLLRVETEINKFLTRPTRNIKDYEAHKWMILKYKELFPTYLASKDYLALGKALLKTNNKEIEAYKALALYFTLNKDFEKSRDWCMKGLELDKDNVRLLCQIVKTYIGEGDKQQALMALMNVTKATTEDEEADQLRKELMRL
ncbi:MAG: hypothetical protein MK132_04325 [Lentisphaerales bacterium]|nr:hypothetical protein [Lentisphaerales bacterium]